MSLKSYYAQQCPSCHKMLSIDVKHLGFTISCRYCRAKFTGQDTHRLSAAINDPINFWINFTDHEGNTRTASADPPERPYDPHVRRRPK